MAKKAARRSTKKTTATKKPAARKATKRTAKKAPAKNVALHLEGPLHAHVKSRHSKKVFKISGHAVVKTTSDGKVSVTVTHARKKGTLWQRPRTAAQEAATEANFAKKGRTHLRSVGRSRKAA